MHNGNSMLIYECDENMTAEERLCQSDRVQLPCEVSR